MSDLRPFTTDGCSGLLMRLVHWHWRRRGRAALSDAVTALCVEHDRAYHPGGSARQRLEADAVLMIGVAKAGASPWFARLMLIGVSVGGVPWLPFPWRWGYGRKWPTGYSDKPVSRARTN